MFAAARIVTTQSASSPLQHVAADNNDSEDIETQKIRLRQQRKRHKRSIARWFGLVRVDQSKIIADRKASDDEASAVNQMLVESTRAYLSSILKCDSGHVHFDDRYNCGARRRMALHFMW